MKFAIYSAAALAALLATPAQAQDESNFAGPYIGAYAGYDDVRITYAGDSGSKDGAAFGAIAGYNFDAGGAVFGIEAELGESSAHQDAYDLLVVGDQAKLSANLDAFIGARAGFKVKPDLLVYAKGGYAHTALNLKYDDGAGTSDDESDGLGGFRVGGGVEYAVSQGINARLEYRYSDYGEYKYDGIPTGLELDRHQVVIGLTAGF